MLLCSAGLSLWGQAAGDTQLNPPSSKAAPKPKKNAQDKEAAPLTGGPAVLPNEAGIQPMKATTPIPVKGSTPTMDAWRGATIRAVEFKGVSAERLAPLPQLLPVQAGQPLDPEKIRNSLRRLYATGLYKTIAVEGYKTGNQVTIIFTGEIAYFLGRITVDGIKGDRLTSLLQRATRLNAGEPYTDAKAAQGTDRIRQTLETNGFFQSRIFTATTVDNEHQQVSLGYVVEQGKQARLGRVTVRGDSGMTAETFRKKGKLKNNSKITRNTVSNALGRLRKQYEKQNRLEANVRLESQEFEPPANHVNYNFQAERGPLVRILVEGVSLSKGKIKNLVPVYEEGAVDEDLLNEGNNRIRDYYQRQGYFDIKVTHTEHVIDPQHTVITFNVVPGPKHEVEAVTIAGNKYFSTDVIEPRLAVQPASLFIRHGIYSAALVDADVDTITALYEGNGFGNVKVTPEVTDTDDLPGSGKKLARLRVKYQIDEGVQQRIGKYTIVGAQKIPLASLTPLLNTQSGQPYSSLNITGDRDAVLTYYLSKGFSQAQVNVAQKPEAHNPNLIDVTMRVTEGDQIFISKVLTSGLHYTKPRTVDERILIHPGEPLNQSALLETQRKLYDLTLFNEVNAAVQNPAGDELRKNVLLQFTEARRWDIEYGAGFQAQTGNPSTNCNAITLVQLGINPNQNCNPNGNFGVSALVELDVSRINLGGTDRSISMKTLYGSLEQQATLIFTNPHIFNNPTLDLSLSGGYTNAQAVTTYAATILQSTLQLTQRPTKPTTLLYNYQFRRTKVNSATVQVSPELVPELTQAARVAGPGFTWVRDTRRPLALDAEGGTYNTVQEFLSDPKFSAQRAFDRLDATNNSYYAFGVKRWVLARSTRVAFIRTYGSPSEQLIPLPERLYGGGPQSLRGFAVNAAGPRDSITGFPIGGAGAFVNMTELRLPNPTLPYFGNSLGFVFFHDMGNVFTKGSDIWRSAIRIKQPHSYTCKDLSPTDQAATTTSNSIDQKGTCDFNDFSHAVGLGLRYHTPIGPVRVDFSYNLNPPIYPVILDYNNLGPNGQPGPAHVGQASHFNFFFSIGQAF
ncbi:MAG: BamA/TamA family outer membrane protein [Acidobacteria bacterium]|nr:BamA/TamA family outer membrane protein [Acidobacteriota bacterium]MBW4046201.1 BamA/TamA family outer membrane protein [Acidobacteriota bacterium]